MPLYDVNLDCLRCGKRQEVYGGPGCGVVSENGPDRADTIADLHEG